MKTYRRLAVAALLPFVMAGCSNYLTGADELTNDPNRPTQATLSQLIAAIQASTWTVQTGETPRAVSMWMQQMAGTDRQYQTLGTYSITESGFETPWVYIYGGGGLVDIRKLQAGATEINDKTYLGIAQVFEALQIGTAADLYGDIPYSEAVGDVATPKLDQQLEVYAAIQTLLSSAITNLSSATGVGPGAADLVYGGSRAKWIALAHTLKARFYMHTAEVDGTAYARALAEAAQGITSSANDYTSVHPGTPGEKNLWYQFIEEQRQGYITPGEYLVSLMDARDDPRLDEYFTTNASGNYAGAPPGAGTSNIYSDLGPDRNDPAFSQPIVTYDENLLIRAEAAYQTNDQATALTQLNQAKANHGVAPVVLAGPALLQEIMLEKYIALFQSLEVWNDWKRTCIPDLTPALSAQIIPARLFYPTGERQTNTNIPEVSAQPLRNDNDPANPGCNSQN
ncbi:MAG: SusD/RagB family nutrient-binding outer membrane lipoprotein [Gemmatimonadaceae bacterium]